MAPGQSRKEFTLEESTSSATQSSGGTKKGLLQVNKKVVVLLGALFITATVTTSLLAVHFTSQTSEGAQPQNHESNIRTNPQQEKIVAASPLVVKHPLPVVLATPSIVRDPPSIVRDPPSVGKDPPSVVSPRKEETVDIRLPTALKPIHYELHLQPFIHGNFSTIGSVMIEIEVQKATDNITLHIADIITKNETITVTPEDDNLGSVAITEHLYDHRRNFYIAKLDKVLEEGEIYYLYMEYEGYLNDQLAGFYRSTYTDSNGDVRYIAVSHFEPTEARKAFPCFDEPAMKATFQVYMTREPNMSSISNMPLNYTTILENGWEEDKFDLMVPVSTYLVAFAVTDFIYVQSDANDHVRFRIWAREEAIGQAEYAKQCGPEVLTFYEEYFNISFPLPKQDMIAVPDFAAGAMENWGLITYRETALLYDDQLSGARNKERVAKVVSHELAHQWFGNLVTLKWWNDLWLNEGFASYVEILGTDHLSPDWEIKNMFVVEDLQKVLELDSLESSHPVSVPVSDPDEINQLFDGISYSKGASIIRMMNYFLTEDTFRKGITDYLITFEYDNAEQDDLWEHLTAAGHEDGTLSPDITVKMIMDTWTLQMGYPVVKVTRTSDGTSATTTQERFLSVKNETVKSGEYRWWVPLSYTTQDSPDFEATVPKTWMTSSDGDVNIPSLPSNDKWVIFNLQETGYYRVNYDENNWNLLTQQLETDHTVIHVANRAQLIDDALDLARAGDLPYNTALSINVYLNVETEYFPWSSAMSNLGYIEGMFSRRGGYGALRKYLLSLLVPLYNSVGFDDPKDDPQLKHYKRMLATSWVCDLDFRDCVDKSVALYQDWMINPDAGSITPNQQSTVYCTGIAEGREEEWDFAWNQYLSTNLGSQKDIILRALGCSKEVWILTRYLEMSITDGSGIKRQDARTVINAVARNDIGRDLAWNFLRDNWHTISEYLGTFTTMGDLVLYISSDFNTREEKHQMELFKEENIDDLGSSTLAIDQAIESISNNIAWMDNYYQVILQWLEDHGYPI